MVKKEGLDTKGHKKKYRSKKYRKYYEHILEYKRWNMMKGLITVYKTPNRTPKQKD